MLSGPLPGTRARDDRDAARALEQALLGFEEVIGVRVILTGDPARSPDAARRAAVQLSLAGGPPPRAWIETVADFILQAVPGLSETDLTIVDTAGNALFVRGLPVEPSRSTVVTDYPHGPPPEGERTAWLVTAALAGAALVAALVLVRRRNGAEIEAPSEPPAPFAFISDLSDEDLCELLRGERPSVVAAIIHLAPAGEAERLRRCCDASELPALGRPPFTELAAALESALRTKLVRQ